MGEINTLVHVDIEHFDGQEEGDVGYPYYVAHSPELHFTTDGKTFEELLANIRECLQLCLEDGDSVAEFGVAPDARVQLIMELPDYHAKTA
jgi:predicted RNase H-like HicB family nuclease